MYLNFLPEEFLSVVESPEVLELSKELDGRLGAIRLQFGHVEVVHKDHYPFTLRSTYGEDDLKTMTVLSL